MNNLITRQITNIKSKLQELESQLSEKKYQQSFDELANIVYKLENAISLREADHKKEIEARKKQEYYLNTIFNNIDAAVFIVDIVDQNNFLANALNPTGEKISGLKSEDIKGKDIAEIFDSKNAEKLYRYFRQCLQDKKMLECQETLVFQNKKNQWLAKLMPIFE